MNTQDLIRKISDEFGISANKANKIIHLIVEETQSAVSVGDTVKIAGLGSFASASVPDRIVRTPAKGDVKVPAHNRVKFRASSMFKDAVK